MTGRVVAERRGERETLPTHATSSSRCSRSTAILEVGSFFVHEATSQYALVSAVPRTMIAASCSQTSCRSMLQGGQDLGQLL